MTTLTIDSAVRSTLVAGQTAIYTATLAAGTQYRFDLHGTDTGVGTLAQPATIEIFRAGFGGSMVKVGELLSYILPRGTHYFTPVEGGDYELRVASGGAGSYEFEIHSPTRVQVGLVANGIPGGVFTATAQDDLILHSNFGADLGKSKGLAFSTIDGGAGFDTLAVTFNNEGWILTREDGAAWLHTDFASSSSALPRVVSINYVKLTGIEAVEKDGGLLYVLDAAHANLPRLYQAALGRAPDLDGVAYYNRVFDSGASLATIATGFVASPEYKAKYGQLNDAAFVGQLYQNVLGRTAAPFELAFYTDRLASSEMSREAVLIGFAASPENKALTGGYIFEV